MEWQLEVTALIAMIGSSAYYVGYVFFYKKIIQPREKLIDEVIKALPKINDIHAEFYTNGGSTMTDRMIRIENNLVRIDQVQYVYLLEHKLGIYQTDSEGNCIAVNRTYCRITDRTEGECLGSSWVDAIHPEDADDVFAAWNKAVKGHREFRMNYRMIKSNGETITVFGTAHPMINQNNKEVIGYMGTIKKTENEG